MSDLIHGAEVLPSSSGSSPSAISHHHRGPVASLSDQSIVPRILSPSSRTSQSQDSSTTRFDGSSVNDFTSTIASSSSPTSEDIEVPDPAIIDALKNAKERLFVLKLGEGMESLIDQRRDTPLQLTPTSSYQRMLVHRCASYYKLHPETDGPNKAIFVSLTPESRIPLARMADIVPSENSSSPAFKIMRRSATDKPNRKGRSGSADVDSDGSDAGSSGISQKKRRNMTIAEREAAYNEARSRIFSSFEDRDELVSANSSTHSLSSPPSVIEATTISTVDEEPKLLESPVSRTASKGASKRSAGKDRWNDTSRSSTSNFDPDFDRNSFNYSSIYEQHPTNGFDAPYAVPPHPPHPDDQNYVPPHYAPYHQPYPGFAPSYLPPYPLYYDPRHYGYPPHPHPPPPPPQAGDSSSSNVPPGGPPYHMYPPGMPGWYPSMSPPTPGPVMSPNATNQTPPLPVPRVMSQGNQQMHLAQQQQQQSPIQAPYFNPIAPPFYPPHFPMANYDPNASIQQQQQQSPQTHMIPTQHQPHIGPPNMGPPGALFSPQDDTNSTSLGPSRFNSSSRGSSRSNVREAAGTAAGRMRPTTNGSSPGPRNPPQLPRNPWSYGSGLGIPMAVVVGSNGRRSGSSSSRAGSVSSRSGSNGAMTPADETGSIASSETSSSSSRKTFTSNSSRHPLPARPDWAVGLPRTNSNHSRRSSGSSSALQSVSSDFPPLSLSDLNPASILPNPPGNDQPITNSAWKPQPVTRQASGSRSQSGDSEAPRKAHSQPTSGGVTLGLAQNSTGSLPLIPSPSSAPPSSRSVSASTLPPPAPSLPPPPHRAYQQHPQQQRLSENDDAFKRPIPKSTLLYDPGSHLKNPSPRNSSPVTVGGNSGIIDYSQAPITQSPIPKSPEEEQNDRLRGEAVASAIFIDRFASLHLSSAVEAAASSTMGSLVNDNAGSTLSTTMDGNSGDVNNASASAVDEVSPLRRGTITQRGPSNHGVMLSSEAA